MARRCARMSGLGVLAALAAAACATAPAHPAAPPPPTPSQPPARTYTAADVAFMAGMIAHRAQAGLIAGWAAGHGASSGLRALCARIVVGQRDEIAAMQRWLAERHEPVPDADPRGHMMPGMDHTVLMPGMLTEEQLARLDSAQGSGFDPPVPTGLSPHPPGAPATVRARVA